MSETTKATITLECDGRVQTISLTCLRVEGDFLYEKEPYYCPLAGLLQPRRISGIRLDFLEPERDEENNYATFWTEGEA